MKAPRSKPRQAMALARSTASWWLSKLQQSHNPVTHSVAALPSYLDRVLNASGADAGEAQRLIEEEARQKSSLNQQLRNLSMDLEALKSQLDDESALRVEAQRSLAKASGECAQWRAKYETEGLMRAEELEEAKRKLTVKLAEAEDQVEQALAKCNSLEKAKQRLQCDMEDLSVDVEKAQASAAAMDKRQRQFDRMIGQWKEKCEAAARALMASQGEARAFSAEVFRLKAELQEQVGQVELLFCKWFLL